MEVALILDQLLYCEDSSKMDHVLQGILEDQDNLSPQFQSHHRPTNINVYKPFYLSRSTLFSRQRHSTSIIAREENYCRLLTRLLSNFCDKTLLPLYGLPVYLSKSSSLTHGWYNDLDGINSSNAIFHVVQ